MTEALRAEFSRPSKSRNAQDFLFLVTYLLIVWDAALCALLGEAAHAFQERRVLGKAVELSAWWPFSRDIVLVSLIVALMLRDPDFIHPKRMAATFGWIMSAQRRCLFTFGLLIAVGVLCQPAPDLDGPWRVAWLIMFAVVVAATRCALSWYLQWLVYHGALREAVAVIGSRDRRERLAAQIGAEADIVGVYDTPSTDQQERPEQDQIALLLELGRHGAVDSVLLAMESDQELEIPPLVERLKALPVQVAICADRAEIPSDSPELRILGGVRMAILADLPIKRHDLLMKTVFDKVVASLLLILLGPLMLAIAIAVGLTSPGPIIFRQTRQGWCGRSFVVFKFRSMRVAPEGSARFRQTQRNDPRCTRVGRILRRTSMDELPQLWNVLLGDMSLVGPRPHVDSLHDIDRAGREVVAEYAQRNRVKPGITGWAQIHGARGATATLDQLRRRVAYDLYYIENWSLWLDMKILARTPFCLMGEDAF